MRGGETAQIKIELEGRAVNKISIMNHQVGHVTASVSLLRVGERGAFVGSSTGDSGLYRIELEHRKLEAKDALSQTADDDLDMDLDEGLLLSRFLNVNLANCYTCGLDLYGDSTIKQNPNSATSQGFEIRAHLRLSDTLPGFGYIMDACLGATRSDIDAPTQHLSLLHGGSGPARINVCRVSQNRSSCSHGTPHSIRSVSAWARNETRPKAGEAERLSCLMVFTKAHCQAPGASGHGFPN
jgi:hypothetical protein